MRRNDGRPIGPPARSAGDAARASASALARLAARCGIEPSFHDVLGELQPTAPETQRRLLAAMGFEVADEPAASRTLGELDEAERAELLPPVFVHRRSGEAAIPLPAGAVGSLHWELTLETGDVHAGRTTAAPPSPALLLPRDLPLGYHRLELEVGGRTATCGVIVAPQRCHVPAALADGQRIWGFAAQLYGLRTAEDLGIGDFADLQSLARVAGGAGADLVGLNPLHALFLDRPDLCSPYSPASRLFLNPLYIDPRALPEFAHSPAAQEGLAASRLAGELERLRATDLIDYRGVTALKLPLLETLYATFSQMAPAERQAEFAAFRAQGGRPLGHFALYQAIRERFAGPGPSDGDWRCWPVPLRSPDGPSARAFAHEHADRVTFHAWLQWVADEQLAAAAATADAAGLRLGFYRDLAVGADPAGAETWSNPGIVVQGARVGAPPDLFNPAGQNWGLPPFDPNRLRAQGYRSFTELCRANLRHARALRIDHVMALQHLFWIPEGAAPAEGAYVSYPMDDLLGVLALESERAQCLVVGEDLGTVPPGFRERMSRAGVLSYRVVAFEWRDGGGLVAPRDYPQGAVATLGSHDLATLRGWWEGHDLELKAGLGLYPAETEAGAQQARRAADRQWLLEALAGAGIALPPGLQANSPWDEALAVASHIFLGQTRAAIAMTQLEDLAGNLEQINLPGSIDEYPNWRRKLALPLDRLTVDPRFTALVAILARSRPRHSTAPPHRPESGEWIGSPRAPGGEARE